MSIWDRILLWLKRKPQPTPTPTPAPTPTPTPVPDPVPPATPTPPAKALFVGDYSTGDFSQWLYVQNRNFNDSARRYTPSYPATIVTDPVKGVVARYELRTGDGALGENGSVVNRSEVEGPHDKTGANEGDIRWYQFATKFGAGFPIPKGSEWAVTQDWHSTSPSGSGPIEWNIDTSGRWCLRVEPQSRPGAYLGGVDVWRTPIGTDWHDVTMQVCWSASDTVGWIKLWHNGIPQVLLTGGTTYYGRTMVPGYGVYYKEGYYRKSTSATGVVFHAGFRVATTEAGLG